MPPTESAATMPAAAPNATRNIMNRFAAVLVCAAFASVAHAQRGPASRLVKEITIDDAAVPDGFTRMGTVIGGPGGRLYVEQPADNVVRVFDSTGKYLRMIGAKGQGPGETENLGGIGFVGDSLWTYDWQARRFAFFSADGSYQSTLLPVGIVDTTVKRNPVTVLASTPLAGGNLFYAAASIRSTMELALARPFARIIATREGRVVDTITMSDSLGRDSFGYASGSRQTFTYDGSFAVLVDRSTLVTAGGAGAWFAIARRADCTTRPRYTVARISLKRDTLWRATIECPQVSVPRNFVDSVVAVNRDKAMKMLPISANYAESQIRPKIGDVKAFTPARSLMVGGDGSIWIRPMRAVRDTVETWIRADAKGGKPEEFTLPSKAVLKYIVDVTHIWVMIVDDDDLPALVRYRRAG